MTQRPSLQIFVLSHDPELLAAVPELPELAAVDLGDLGLTEAQAVNKLSESRFFLSQRADTATADYVGVVSGAHDSKYADRNLLRLRDLPALRPYLEPHRVFAPMPVPGGDPGWMGRFDDQHPGLTALVQEAALLMPEADVTRQTLMTSSFIAHRDVYFDFLAKWRSIYREFDARYGFDFPFTYRCTHCGTLMPEGVGRYGPDRHPAFFHEGVVALYFSRPGLEIRPLRRADFETPTQLVRRGLGLARRRIVRRRPTTH